MIRLKVLAVLAATSLLTACGGITHKSSSSVSTPVSQPSSQVPASAKVVGDIQLLTNWSSCSGTCSGQTGTNAVYSMEFGIKNPAVTGSAIKFNITDGTPWNTALWWKQVGGDDAKTHFVYELQFLLDNPNAAQALEFNVNQNAGGWRYEYATQCDFRGDGMWRIWDHAAFGWVSTGKPCPTPVANQWNKLVWEFERTPDQKVKFVAVTLNGQRSDINLTSNAFAASGSGIDVAFQMDSVGAVMPWSAWVDEIKLSEW